MQVGQRGNETGKGRTPNKECGIKHFATVDSGGSILLVNSWRPCGRWLGIIPEEQGAEVVVLQLLSATD